MSVNPKKRGRPSRGGSKLTREAIVTSAREWTLKENRKLSIRALASHLEVDPMAIYHYFANKTALLEAITVSIMQGIYMPDRNGSWQVELKKLCRSYLTLLRDHPGFLETLLSMGEAVEGPAGVFRERFDMTVSTLNMEKRRKMAALDLIVDYLHGFALAMHCAVDKSTLNISAMEEPMELYLSMLQPDASMNTKESWH